MSVTKAPAKGNALQRLTPAQRALGKAHAFVILFMLGVMLVLFYFLNKAWPERWVLFQGGAVARRVVPYVGTILYGLIDAMLFFVIEEELFDYLDDMFHDLVITSMVIGAISGFFAIFIGKSVQEILEKSLRIRVEPSPMEEAVGLVIGTGIIIVLYKAGAFRKLVPKTKEHNPD
jgi:hypothetical protein